MKVKRLFTAVLASFCAVFAVGQLTFANASAEGVDIIAATNENEWFHNEKTEDQGVWTSTSEKVSVDAYGCNYAMEGANYLTSAAPALGAYEFEATIKITELNSVENPMVGIIPLYIDEDNYLSLQIKFSYADKYKTTDAERADGHGIEQLLFSGKYDGEGRYITTNQQQENTTYDALTTASLAGAKLNPTSSQGHKLKVRIEATSAMALSYTCTIFYNDVQIGKTDAYFYNANPVNLSVGFMAQDVKAEFTDARLNDFVATNATTALARDWKQNNGYTYRMLNGVDVWQFNDDESITFNTEETVVNGKESAYSVSGSSIAGYDTNRGFTENIYKEVDGLPQNYQISSTFKLNSLSTAKKFNQGYGLLPWYKDDLNFVYVSFRRVKTLKTVNEIVLSGWIEYSSAECGQNVYTLPSDFDFTAEHTLTVKKISNRFFVYLDDIAEPILSKQIKGTEINYNYGYDGYSSNFTATRIEAKAIYDSYDEISVLDEAGTNWRVSGASQTSWIFDNGTILINAKDNDNELDNRSYIVGLSDVCDTNMDVIVEASVELGAGYYSELMLSPYIYDEYNYARIGLVWKNGKTYARVHASTSEDGDDPIITMYEAEIPSIDLSNSITVKAEKINTTLALYVNGNLVYGKVVEGIFQNSVDYGVYVYNMDIAISNLSTAGYKKYEIVQVGNWTTSGMKYNEWTVNEEGYLIGDGTYTDEMQKDELDGERNYALQLNELATNGQSYEITATMKAGKQSEAEDRLGLVMWYVDEDNFMLLYMDHWRSDSSVPRTTVYGKLNGETLPTTFNHGGWFPEGDNILDSGLTQTEASQVTEFHTVKVIKEGDTFTCYIDRTNCGYISYRVAAGLPDVTGKNVYSGIYTFNDEVIVSSYDVTAVGGFSKATLPAEAGNPITAAVYPPVLADYNEFEANDEFTDPTGPEEITPEKDTTKPTLNITTSTTATAGDEIEVTYVANDNKTAQNNLVVSIVVKKGNVDVALTNNKFVAEEGTYTITITVTDEASNSETKTITINVAKGGNTEPEPTTTETPTTSANQGSDSSSKGCGGSVIASTLGVTLLWGAVLVLRKKKED